MKYLLETLGGIFLAAIVLVYGFPEQADRIGQSALKAQASVSALLPRLSETISASDEQTQVQPLLDNQPPPARPTFTMVVGRDNYGFDERVFVESYSFPTCNH